MEHNDGRCKGCKYAKTMVANGQWQFVGCTHEPHKGKWVAEIKQCPKHLEKLEKAERKDPLYSY
jgi:hypothetical protein